jgi:hypothetical protein
MRIPVVIVGPDNVEREGFVNAKPVVPFTHENPNGGYNCTCCGNWMDDFGGPGGLCTPCTIKSYPDATFGDITGDSNNGSDTYGSAYPYRRYI